MKKTALILSALILLTSYHSFAQARRTLRDQASAAPAPTATVAETRPAAVPASDGAPKVLLGTIETVTSSREKILAYPRLLPQELGCEVKGFTFSISAGDKNWTSEAIKGAVFNEDIKDRIKEWEAPKMQITINNIKVVCNGKEMTANPIVIDYDH